jgi:selenocysteine lyase/cysteine desulfurase
MNDDVSITALLHKYGALSFWDYAAAAPYVKIDMNPKVFTFLQSLKTIVSPKIPKNYN